jgi:hypothetical protein
MTWRERKQFECAVGLLAALLAWVVTSAPPDQAPATVGGLFGAMLAPVYALMHEVALPLALVAGLWCLWLTRRLWRR